MTERDCGIIHQILTYCPLCCFQILCGANNYFCWITSLHNLSYFLIPIFQASTSIFFKVGVFLTKETLSFFRTKSLTISSSLFNEYSSQQHSTSVLSDDDKNWIVFICCYYSICGMQIVILVLLTCFYMWSPSVLTLWSSSSQFVKASISIWSWTV